MSVLRQTRRRAPSVPVVVGFLMGRGAVVQPMPESSQRWPSGTYRAFLPNTSTRGVSLSIEGGRFTLTRRATYSSVKRTVKNHSARFSSTR